MKKILIIFLLIVFVFLTITPFIASAQENKLITASTSQELEEKLQSFVYQKLNDMTQNFSVTVKGDVLKNYTYDSILNEPTPYEGSLIDKYIRTSGNDYMALFLRVYTISKTVWKSSIGNTPSKLLLECKIVFDETLTERQFVEEYARIQAQIATTGISGNYERIKALHDFITNTFKYDTESQDDDVIHSTYKMLSKKRGVCSAYAGLMYELLKASGYDARIVFVSAHAKSGSKEEAHAWNMVKIGDEWFHIDTTWDDPITSTGINEPNLNYFLISDEQILKDHSFDASVYPQAPNSYNPLVFEQNIPQQQTSPTVADNTNSKIYEEDHLAAQTSLLNSLNNTIDKEAYDYISSRLSDGSLLIYLIGSFYLVVLFYKIFTLRKHNE